MTMAIVNLSLRSLFRLFPRKAGVTRVSPRPEPTVVSQTCIKVGILGSPQGANPAVLAGSHLSPSPDTLDLWLQSRPLPLNKRHGNLAAWGWERAG